MAEEVKEHLRKNQTLCSGLNHSNNLKLWLKQDFKALSSKIKINKQYDHQHEKSNKMKGIDSHTLLMHYFLHKLLTGKEEKRKRS